MNPPRAAHIDTALAPLKHGPRSNPVHNPNERGGSSELVSPDPAGPNCPRGRPALDEQTHDVRRLATQIEQLLKSVDTLLRLHEHEVAQRKALQVKLDRAIEEIALTNSARVADGLGDEIRRGVSDDLKPYLHAIVDLVELSTQRARCAPNHAWEDTPADTGPPQGSSRPAQTGLGPADDLPCALPDILTKTVEELVGSARFVKPTEPMRDNSLSKARRPHGRLDPSTLGKRISGAPGTARLSGWIPVTSDTTKS